MADTDVQYDILLAQCKSMVIELGERLGGENPWALLDLGAYNVSQLVACKRMLHELLYAPPSRAG